MSEETFHVADPWIAAGANNKGHGPCTSIYRAMSSEYGFMLVGHMLGHILWSSIQHNPEVADHTDGALAVVRFHALAKVDELLAGDAAVTHGDPADP